MDDDKAGKDNLRPIQPKEEKYFVLKIKRFDKMTRLVNKIGQAV